jgi:hypothetical protein
MGGVDAGVGGGGTYQEGQAALGEMHHGRVEVGALVECRRDHGGREGRGGLGEAC